MRDEGAAELDQDRPWFQDLPGLLTELKRSTRHWGEAPQIPGYDRFVEIRRGGQGVVYRAHQRSTDRPVAIKLLLEGALAPEPRRSRFQREVELVARLRHPFIVRVYDSGLTPDGCLYYAMELVDGCPLDAYAPPAPLGLAEKLQLFVRICEAVRHAHQHGVIHRDLKPNNILVDDNGDPHLLDFGLAKIAGGWPSGEGLELSQTGQFLGSIGYASPEQFGESPDLVDLRADVYSLGVILYQLLTGRLPHTPSGNLKQTIHAIVYEPPKPPSAALPSLPDDLETLVLRSLAKEPDRRYQSADELMRDVRHCLRGEPIEAKRDHTLYVLRKTVGRHKAVSALLLLLLVLLGGFAASMSFLYTRTLRAEEDARENLAASEVQTSRAEAVRGFLTDMLSSSDPLVSHERPLTVERMLDGAASGIGGRFSEHPLVEAEIRSVMGSAYYHLGRLDDAEEHDRAALALLESARDPDPVLRARLLLNQGCVDLDRGHFEEADSRLTLALEQCMAHFGEDDPRTADCLQILAQLRQAEFRLDEADALYAQANAIYREQLDPTATRALACIIQWSGLLVSRSEMDRAIGLLKPVEEIVRQDEEEYRHLWSVVFFNLGLAYFNMGDLERAEAALTESLDSQIELYGRVHPRTPEILIQLGHVRREQGRHGEAEAFYREALELYSNLTGRRSIGGASALWSVAQSLWNQGDRDGALEAFEEALATRRQIFGADHHYLMASVSRLGLLLAQAGLWEDALPYLEEAVTLRRQSLGADHRLTARARALLGECLTHLEWYAESETELLRALSVLEAVPDAPSTHREHALRALVGLYTAWGKPERAAHFEGERADL